MIQMVRFSAKRTFLSFSFKFGIPDRGKSGVSISFGRHNNRNGSPARRWSARYFLSRESYISESGTFAKLIQMGLGHVQR